LINVTYTHTLRVW